MFFCLFGERNIFRRLDRNGSHKARALTWLTRKTPPKRGCRTQVESFPLPKIIGCSAWVRIANAITDLERKTPAVHTPDIAAASFSIVAAGVSRTQA